MCEKATDVDFREAMEHLNCVVALMLPFEYSATASAALFLLNAHRKYGTPIRQSVYDAAVAFYEVKS